MEIGLTVLSILNAGQALQTGPVEGREWLSDDGCHGQSMRNVSPTSRGTCLYGPIDLFGGLLSLGRGRARRQAVGAIDEKLRAA